MKIINGDCLEVLKTLEENSIDSVVCDPPYELGFMGKSWDNTGIAYKVELWSEVLRVLKPGGHLLSFGGTRTYHRMACSIEDAGFEIRDMISWLYGSGFPKSLNIGKVVDKLQGNNREVIGKLENYQDKSCKGGVNPHMMEVVKPRIDIELTKGTSPYEGWGTALKPACEPCVLARKPLSEKTVAENVLKWGTGGINIDGSRVKIEKGDEPHGGYGDEVIGFGPFDNKGGVKWKESPDVLKGRFPANIIHDGSDEVLEVFPNSKSGNGKASKYDKFGGQWGKGKQIRNADYGDNGSASRFFYCAKASKSERNKGCEELVNVKKEKILPNFKCNKCGFWQNKGAGDGVNFCKCEEPDFIDETIRINKNNHPTVKPLALMKYLIEMITPPKGIVLDPFSGSGSTLVAAKELGFDFIGIEKEPEYIKIIEARTGVKVDNYLDSRTPEERKEEGKVEPITTTAHSNLSKCCNAKIIKGYCEKCCEKVK
jgi:site-specific DNA-methyltransferase (adenine-specific)